MASRPNRACRYPRCPGYAGDGGYCEAHASHKRERDRWRGSAASRGYDYQWQQVRVRALKRDKYLCQMCLADGRVTPAVDVDHITPIRADSSRRLDLDNLQSLCRPCHRAKTEREQGN